MDKQEIKKLFEEFLLSYDVESKDAIWKEQSNKFKNFWNDKIMSHNKEELNEGEVDEIIRILDSNAKGKKKGSEVIAKTMIVQNKWRRMLNNLKDLKELSSTLNSVFFEIDDEVKAKMIDKVYELNEKRKNSLTGTKGNAINVFLAAFNPFQNSSIVSLDDRKKIIDYFGLGDTHGFDELSIGTNIVNSNRLIIQFFGSLGIKHSARTITKFFYSSEVKKRWKIKDSPTPDGRKKIFLVPRSNEQSYATFKSTVTDGVPFERIKDFLDKEGTEILSKEDKIFVWGSGESCKSKWDKMQKGDYVLFYVKGVFKYAGELIYKKFSSELSDAMWPRKKSGTPWSCTFFINNITDIYIPLKEINEIAGYKMKSLLGFQMLCNKGLLKIYDKFESPDKFFKQEFPRLQVHEEIDIEPADFKKIEMEIEALKKIDHQSHALDYGRPIRITELVKKAEGEWVLPNFQRYFDWGKNDIRDLLESIYYDYFVGSLLLWETKDVLELDVINIKGVQETNVKPKNIILDGQQRITSIYYAIKSPEFNLKDTSVPIFFYIDFKAIISGNSDESIIKSLNNKYSDEETFETMLFPFYKLERFYEWTNKFEDYISETKGVDLKCSREIKRLIEDKVRHIWDGYEIPFISLPETLDLKPITDVFERINSRGKQLSTFDLLIARLLKYDIKLRDIWEETKRKYGRIKKYYKQFDKTPLLIFQSLSLFYHNANSAKRKDILNIYENIYQKKDGRNFQQDWDEITYFMDKAIQKLENLKDGFGVKTEKDTPFLPTLPVLTAILKQASNISNIADANRKIETWYWSAVMSNAYSSAADTRATQDFKEMKEWFDNTEATPTTVTSARTKFQILNLREIESSSNAIYKGVLSLIGLHGAIDFNTGLSFGNAKVNHKDHLFPKSLLKRNDNVNSVLNMTWMSAETNMNIKKAKKPSVYYLKFKNNFLSEEEYKKTMASHFISNKAIAAMREDNFEKFLQEREKSILSHIATKIGASFDEKSYLDISPDTPFDNKMALINVIKKCDEKIYWVDKYFSLQGLKLIREYSDLNKVKDIKVISSINRITNEFRSLCKNLIIQFSNSGVDFKVKVFVDKKIYSQIHDRYIITNDHIFNIPSPDIAKRGQFSNVSEVKIDLPFDKWWESSLDIVKDWNEIEKFRTKLDSN